METLNAFVSVGSASTDQQEAFVKAVEERLRAAEIVPCTVGRNRFSVDAPFKAITELMDTCSGAVIIAFERLYFPSGLEMRGGSRQKPLTETKLTTPWNQIEAAMANSRGLPLLVIVEDGLKMEGLLERSYGWYVLSVKLESGALTSPEFNGVFADWQKKVNLRSMAATQKRLESIDPTSLTVGELFALIGRLKPAQLWGLLVALCAVLAGVFALGGKLAGK